METFVFCDGHPAQQETEVAVFEVRDEEPAFAGFVGAGGAADAVDVAVTVAGKTELDDVCYVGEVHATGCDVGGEEDGGGGAAEDV